MPEGGYYSSKKTNDICEDVCGQMETKRGSESAPESIVNSSPIIELPLELLLDIFYRLTLREIVLCRCVCRLFHQTLTSSSFLRLDSRIPPLHLLILIPSTPHHHHHSFSILHALDPFLNQLLRFPFDFITPFQSTKITPVASSSGLLYLWSNPHSSLIVCNPLTRCFRLLFTLGSSWSLRHATVIVGSPGEVVVFNNLSALYYSPKFGRLSTYLAYKCRSPILVSKKIFALRYTGSPPWWQPNQSPWKLFSCKLQHFCRSGWERVEKDEWNAFLNKLEQPRLIRGRGNNESLMAGGLKSWDAPCSTFIILRLDLDSLEWDEVGRMPEMMFKWFEDSPKLKAFGGGDWVYVFGKSVRRVAMWNSSSSVWRWLHGVDGRRKSVHKGFVFDATLTAVP